jgi:CheY-like chemotaxis protein
MKKILLVDDKSDYRAIFSQMIRKFGYYVDEVDSGKAAIDYATEKPPDIIVMDTVMPDMAGYEACKKIKKLRKMAIIGMSEKPNIIFEEKWGNCGSPLFKKSVLIENPEILREAIESCLI